MDDTSMKFEILEGQIDDLKSLSRAVRSGSYDEVMNADSAVFGSNGPLMIEQLREAARDLIEEIETQYPEI